MRLFCVVLVLWVEWEESVEFCVDHIGDFLEVLRVAFKLCGVSVDDDEVALVVLDPLFVAVVESLQVVDAYGLLVVASAFGDLCDEVWDG